VILVTPDGVVLGVDFERWDTHREAHIGQVFANDDGHAVTGA
jgi:hypothetical protein